MSNDDIGLVKPLNVADSLSSNASIHNPEETQVACKAHETNEAL